MITTWVLCLSLYGCTLQTYPTFKQCAIAAADKRGAWCEERKQ